MSEEKKKISSPEQLSDYLHVTTPGIWIILISVILVLAGLLIWSIFGTLETKAQSKAIVKDGKAEVFSVTDGSMCIEVGMPVYITSKEYSIDSTWVDENGAVVGVVDVDIPDGDYEAYIVTEQIHPISFLVENN